ncbi:MAG: RDD family protein [Actinomycetota bacterium]
MRRWLHDGLGEEGRAISEPVQRRGEWWQQRSDGAWLKWDTQAARWEEQTSPPPPPDATPTPSGVPQWGGWESGSEAQQGYQPSSYGRSLPTGTQWSGGPTPPLPAGASQPYAPQATTRVALAGWGRRAAAIVIDGLLLGVVLAIGFVLVLAVMGGLDGSIVTTESNDEATAMLIAVGVANFLIAPAYYTLFHGGPSGATPGKRILGLRVADSLTGAPIGYGRAFLRWLVSVALWWVVYIGGILDILWPLWDDRNQTLHDKAANSVVVRMNY